MSLPELMEMVGKEGKFQIFVICSILSASIPLLWSNSVNSFNSYEPDWCCVYDATHPNPVNISDTSSCIDIIPHQYRGRGNDSHNNSDAGVTIASRILSSSSSSSYKRRQWNDDDIDDNNCDLQDILECQTVKYLDDEQARTAVTEWNLTCDREWITKLIISIQMVGLVVGSLLAGVFSDMMGRKKMQIIACVMCTVFSAAVAFSNSWELFAVLKFFVGVSMGIFLVVYAPYLFEFLTDRWRLIAASVPVPVLGLSIFPLFVWAVHDFSWAYVIISAVMGVFTIPGLFIPESIRWLTVKGKIDKAVEEARVIARFNGRLHHFEPDKARTLIQNAYEASQKAKLQPVSQIKHASYLDLFRNKDIAWLTIRLQFLAIAAGVIEQGVLFDVESLDGNFYINMFLTSAFDGPVMLLTYFFSHRVGKKLTTCVLLALATVVAVVALVMTATGNGESVTYVSIAMRALWYSVGIYRNLAVNEVLPTELRSYGMAATQFALLVGGTIASFAVDLDDEAVMSYCIMLSSSLIGFIIVLTMKESSMMTMEEADVFCNSYSSQKQSPYHSIERYPVPQKYYQTDEYGGENKTRLRPDGCSGANSSPYTSLTHLLVHTNDTKERSDNRPPLSHTHAGDEGPDLSTSQTDKGYGSVLSSSPPISQLESSPKEN